jgi:hypothetical protein
MRVEVRLQSDLLGLGRRPDGFHRVFDDARDIHHLALQTQLAGDDPRDIEQVFDQT